MTQTPAPEGLEPAGEAVPSRDRRIGRRVGLAVLALPLILVLYTTILAIARPVHEERFERVDPATFRARSQAPQSFVIDLAPTDGVAIPGTDLTVVPQDVLREPSLPNDRGAEILVYDVDGVAASDTAGVLAAEGYVDVSVLDGGIAAWRDAGLPLD